MTPMNSTYVLGSGAASGDYPGGSVWTKYKTLDFDAATEEGGLFSIMMPKSWDKGYMSFKPVWAASGTGNVLWQLYLSSWSNGETPTNNYNAAQITAASTGNGVITLSAESTAVIPHGIDATDTQLIHGFIYRYASNGADTLAVDAKLIGIQIYYNTNLSNDT
jgi:hypothetical protein